METTASKTRESSRKSAGNVLPKINVRPAREEASGAAPLARDGAGSTGGKKPQVWSEAGISLHRRTDWDVKFALALIFLVVLVNATLTMLLGGDGEQAKEETIFQQQTEAKTLLPEKTAATLGTLAPAAGTQRETKVFISREDKRVLLRQLNAEPAEPVKRTAPTPGTYHSVGEGGALSIIGTDGSAPESGE